MDVAAKIDRGNDIENIKNQLVVKHSLGVTKFYTYHYVYSIRYIFFVEIV